MNDPEEIAKDLLVAYLSTHSQFERLPNSDKENGAKTGQWIGEAFVALVERIREGRRGS